MKLLLFSLGWLSFSLGLVGAFIPVLPTTPFLILSAFLFSKSSPKFHAWIMSLPMAGPAVKDWQENRVIRTKAKLMSVLMMSLSMLFIWIMAQTYVWIKVLATLILFAVGLYVVTRSSGSIHKLY